jgi:hypothetical protein
LTILISKLAQVGLHLGSDNAMVATLDLVTAVFGPSCTSLRGRKAFQPLGKRWSAKQAAFMAGFPIRVLVHTRRRVFLQHPSKLSLFPRTSSLG